MPLLRKWTDRGAVFGIWQVDETAEVLRAMLASPLPYDRELSCLKAPARRMEYLAVRVLLRALCGEEKQVLHHASGKPYLADGSFRVTISHTCGYVAAGIHPKAEVGIDIEYASDRVKKVACRFMRPDEEAGTLAALLLHWSAKETVYKMVSCEGVDFIRHLRVFPFPLQGEGCMEAAEYLTEKRECFTLHYLVCPAFVCTWSVKDI